MAPRDVTVVQGEFGIIYRPSNHLVRVQEIVLVMAIRATECGNRSNRVSPPSCATCTLLIVGPRRRHIAQRDAGEGANIDPNLHSRRARKDINGGAILVRAEGTQTYILKKQFVLFRLGKYLVGLRTIELRGVLSRDECHRRTGWSS